MLDLQEQGWAALVIMPLMSSCGSPCWPQSASSVHGLAKTAL
uniref:Uncharacterized protein n=1 Tax=Anguilla anguilla TaxID=7936 RepID=A0A0E9RSG5_ANGAN